ncbi:MAG: Cna B-type domain-containing protein, partial [Clostridia bacterium]|nr:Cna B-type domain-containing protein [Clostridia bacterium]
PATATPTLIITPNVEKTTISGRQTWEHGSCPEEERPQSVNVKILADGVLLAEKEVTQADHWSWRVEADKYAEDGHEIVYTVDEEDIPQYIQTVSGFNVHNVYSDPGSPSSASNPGDNTGPDGSGGSDGASGQNAPGGCAAPGATPGVKDGQGGQNGASGANDQSGSGGEGGPTETPGGNARPGGGPTPFTGDNLSLTLWAMLMLTSFTGLIAMSLGWRRLNGPGGYRPKH